MKGRLAIALLIASSATAFAHNKYVNHGIVVKDELSPSHFFGDYVIAHGGITYSVQEPLLHISVHPEKNPAHLTVNGPVSFYVHKNKLRFIDDDGKKHETVIVRQEIAR